MYVIQYMLVLDNGIHLWNLLFAESSFDQHGGRMTSPTSSANDVTVALSPPLCHSSPAAATVASSNSAPWSPRYQYGSPASGVAMTTFRCDSAQPSHVTGSGGGSGRLPGSRDDDVSRCECVTCAATRYCDCCYSQPQYVYTPQRVADV